MWNNYSVQNVLNFETKVFIIININIKINIQYIHITIIIQNRDSQKSASKHQTKKNTQCWLVDNITKEKKISVKNQLRWRNSNDPWNRCFPPIRLRWRRNKKLISPFRVKRNSTTTAFFGYLQRREQNNFEIPPLNVVVKCRRVSHATNCRKTFRRP